MRRLVPIFPICLIAFAASLQLAHPAAPPRAALKDRYGDALPPGAVARLGTLRYRVPDYRAIGLGFTPDGERIVASTQYSVEVLESKTGRRVRSIRLDFHPQGFALSRDGKLAAVAGGRFQPGRDPESVVCI